MELPLATVAAARRLLKPGGYFVLEHAEVQAETISKRMVATGDWENVTTHPDLNGRARATSAIPK